MRPLIWKAIALTIPLLFLVPALIAAGQAQSISSIAPGEPHPPPKGIPPHGQCPAGFHYDPYTRQCVPNSAFPPGEPGLCPAGYYYDTARQQCMPDMPRPLPASLAPF